MKNVSKESLLYQIESKIAESKKEKATLVAEKQEVPTSLNARIDSLVLIKSELIRENKNNKEYQLTNSDEVVLLTKMAEKRKDNVKAYSDNGRPELAEAEYNELGVINEFLPKMPTEEEINTFISDTIDNYRNEQGEDYALSMKDMGKIKGIVTSTYPTINGSIIKDVLMTKINGSK